MSTTAPSTTAARHQRLFESVQLGPYLLANRIVMAPLTRSRALEGDVPSELAITYYRQRASAGLIIAEATQISPQGKGYVLTPGIYNDAQVQAWKKITAAVHSAGGRIFLQLWHVGRISHPSIQLNGELPVAPSAIAPAGNAYNGDGYVPMVTPRALRLDEMPGIVEQYRSAAVNALAADFDGVEIHAANGYLLDQFLRDKSNQRTDAYGGSIENRTRLLTEVTTAVTAVWGGDRVGVRISPLSKFGDIADSNPQALFTHVIDQLNHFNLAYLHVIEGDTGGEREPAGGFDLQILRDRFNGAYMANNGYDADLAEQHVTKRQADLVAFGRPFIGNPDLVERIRIDAPMNPLDQATLYGGGAHGYVDYPTLAESSAT